MEDPIEKLKRDYEDDRELNGGIDRIRPSLIPTETTGLTRKEFEDLNNKHDAERKVFIDSIKSVLPMWSQLSEGNQERVKISFMKCHANAEPLSSLTIKRLFSYLRYIGTPTSIRLLDALFNLEEFDPLYKEQSKDLDSLTRSINYLKKNLFPESSEEYANFTLLVHVIEDISNTRIYSRDESKSYQIFIKIVKDCLSEYFTSEQLDIAYSSLIEKIGDYGVNFSKLEL